MISVLYFCMVLETKKLEAENALALMTGAINYIFPVSFSWPLENESFNLTYSKILEKTFRHCQRT